VHSDERFRKIVDELSGRIYVALRDGGLDAEPVVELACALYEWGWRGPAVQEVLEHPAAQLRVQDVIRLGHRLLEEIHFEPTFALEPGLWTTLEQALRIVERDARATGITGTLRLAIPDWHDNGHAWVEFENAYQGNGMPPGTGSSVRGALSYVADAAQEVIMEMIGAVWPSCPQHDLGLHAEVEHGTAVWRCAGAGRHTVAPVGELSLERR
jgi:hypothetical protein